MKNKLMPLFDKLVLRKRSMIESINNQLKNVFQIEHTRHRSPVNGFINIIAGLIAFTHHDKKPKLDVDASNVAPLVSCGLSGCQLKACWHDRVLIQNSRSKDTSWPFMFYYASLHLVLVCQ